VGSRAGPVPLTVFLAHTLFSATKQLAATAVVKTDHTSLVKWLTLGQVAQEGRLWSGSKVTILCSTLFF
jgi:hypothetical protein